MGNVGGGENVQLARLHIYTPLRPLKPLGVTTREVLLDLLILME